MHKLKPKNFKVVRGVSQDIRKWRRTVYRLIRIQCDLDYHDIKHLLSLVKTINTQGRLNTYNKG